MKKNIYISICAAVLFYSYGEARTIETITVDFAKKGAAVSPGMYGIFFEEINHSGEGGLYAEMVQNRGFEDTSIPDGGFYVKDGKLWAPPLRNHMSNTVTANNIGYRWPDNDFPAWSLGTGSKAKMSLFKDKPLHRATPTSLLVEMSGDGETSLINSGFWGMNFVDGETYKLRFYARKSYDYTGNAVVKLVAENGSVLSQTNIVLKNNDQWNEYRINLKSVGSSAKGKLCIDFKGSGLVWLDYVSLFPEHTFMNRENGLRNDVAKMLADLDPGFVRWPGGCIVEGISRDNRIKWKETVGDPMTRPGSYNAWGYRASMGFGYHEFLQFCEDLNADGMYVCNVGIGCQGRCGDACTHEEVEFYVNDALDALEYALGDKTTRWGKKRIDNGHEKPFPLKYVEIGNENWGSEYIKRFDIFYKAIKQKYPQLILISNYGLNGEQFHEKVDMVDPHWYSFPGFFFSNDRLFDHQKRTGTEVYIGEYACNNEVGGGNMLAALSEAAFLTGAERNSDLVTMTSYAPLLENVNDRVWSVNLIWVDTDKTVGRSSYYVQKMYSNNKPTYNLATDTKKTVVPRGYAGKVGLGTWSTVAEYKDVVATPEGGKPIQLSGAADVQPNGTPMKWSTFDNMLSPNFTLQLKAKKTSGEEGFLIFFGIENLNGFVLNIGGWGNTGTALEKVYNGKAELFTASVPQSIETGVWYDLKIVVKDCLLSYYCNNKLVYQAALDGKQQFVLSGYDEKTKEIILKVVNAGKEPYSAKINLNNVKVEPKGSVITLSAKSELEENSMQEPTKIAPVESTYSKFSSVFNYNFAPWSFTVLRIKTKN